MGVSGKPFAARLRSPVLLLVAILAGASTGPAAAQSLFSTSGLGVPTPPLDARARALGGVGLGLIGINTSLVNPADAAGLRSRGVAAGLQATSRSIELGGAESDLSGTRFPAVRIFYPLRERVVVSLGYGSYLDQSWGIEAVGTTSIGGEDVVFEESQLD